MTAVTTAYRDLSGGTKQSSTFNVYEYTFALIPSKTVFSITLPNDPNVEVLAATVVPGSATQTNNSSTFIASAFNRTGIVADGTAFSGGLDGYGSALSANLLGNSISAGGVTFNLGHAGANDVVSADGQKIALPTGSDATLDLLATGVGGAQPNQSFTVTYTDGTTQTFTQSISDWAAPQGYPGETTAVTTAYRDLSYGAKQGGTFRIYLYTFALDLTKTVSTLTLPNDPNVEVLAANLVP